MTNVQSKLVPVISSCKEYAHPWTDSCYDSTAGLLIQAAIYSGRIYTVVYLLSLMTRGRIPTALDVKRTIMGILQSTAFLTTNAYTFIMFTCLLRNTLGSYHFLTVSYMPAFLASLCAILVERPARRIMLTLYVANVATEAAWSMAVSRGLVKSIPHGQTIIFGVSASILMYLYRLGLHHKYQDSLFNIFRFVVGKSEEGQAPVGDDTAAKSPAAVLGVEGVEGAVGTEDRVGRRQRRNHYSDISFLVRIYLQIMDKVKSLGKHKSCPHNHSCIHYSIGGGTKLFMVGYGLQVVLKMVLQVKKIIQRKVNMRKLLFSRETMKLGMFLGGFSFLYKSVSCSLRHATGHDDPIFAIPAGLVASSAFIKYPDVTVALYVMWKMLQITYTIGIDKGVLPSVPGFQNLLYCSSTALLFHVGILEPKNLRPSYWKFLQGISGGRVNVMDRRPFDVWGLESSQAVRDILKATNTQVTRPKFAY